MSTPICDFVRRYTQYEPVRFHMPGHKGVPMLGFEPYDITEIDGADSLYEASGIIRESERQGYVSRLRSIHIYNKYQVIIQKHQLFFCDIPLSLDTQGIDSDIHCVNTLHALAIHK